MRICYFCHRLFIHYLAEEHELSPRRNICNCPEYKRNGFGRTRAEILVEEFRC